MKKKKTIFIEPDIETAVISSGGVGTTFLIKHLGKYKTTNNMDNNDGIKHLIIPPLTKRKDFRVIYIFGDPILATISLFRRGNQQGHAQQIQKYAGFQSPVPQENSLEEYVNQRIDKFLFEEHFKNWNNQYRFYDTLFIRYDSLFDHLKVIKHFLELNDDFEENFPARKNRVSKIHEIGPDTRQGLTEMYGEFQLKVNKLPDFWIKEGQRTSALQLFLRSAGYRMAFIYAFFQMFPLLRKIRNRIQMMAGWKKAK